MSLNHSQARTDSIKVFASYKATFIQNETLLKAGFDLVDTAEEADWALISRAEEIQKVAGKVPSILIYTLEPRFAIGEPQLQIINGSIVYTCELSLGNFSDIWQVYINLWKQSILAPTQGDRSGSVLMSTFSTYYANRHPADLVGVRGAIGEYGARHGLLDIFGIGWGDIPTLGDSHRGDGEMGWPEIKHNVLASYRFNFALENTYVPNYISEKLWQAIQAGCLPVYFGSTWLDRLVDRALYIDLRDYATPAEVFSALSKISEQERVDRVNALQERLIELRTSTQPGIYAAWERGCVERIIDLQQQQDFFHTTWAEKNAPLIGHRDNR